MRSKSNFLPLSFVFSVIITLVIACSPHPGPEVNLTTAEPQGEPRAILFERIGYYEDWYLDGGGGDLEGRGVLNSESELSRLWDDLHTFASTESDKPQMPSIDFQRYVVLWYDVREVFAISAEMNSVLEFENLIEVHLTISTTDYNNNDLYLWIIPRTGKDIRLVETIDPDLFHP